MSDNPCSVHPYLSRVCKLGTKGCRNEHNNIYTKADLEEALRKQRAIIYPLIADAAWESTENPYFSWGKALDEIYEAFDIGATVESE